MNRISPYQTIITKVIPATNTKPTRVKATANGGTSVTESFGYCGDEHASAMRALCKKLHWDYRNYHGGEVRGVGIVWIRVEG
jgi:hypothetical protein